ncbi:MAG: alpha/beta hydrolase [Acidobacteria bacterium]|nr:alpha/beta hydrolase [Acidobacteriota bacterium]
MKIRAIILLLFLFLLTAILTVAAGPKGPWEDKYLQIGDIKIHYLEAGEGDRVLVFIPGWILPAEVWKEQIPYFSARGFRVIALDPRSQGQTTKTEVGNTYHQHAADLHAFLGGLNIEHSYLVGWSAGVTTLLEYLSSPETLRPEKVVFVEGSPAFIKQDDFPGSITAQQARKLLFSFQDNRTTAIDQYVRSLFKVSHPEILYKEISEGSRKIPLSAAFSLYFDQYTGDRRPALRHVQVPALIIASPENRVVGEYMKSRIARCSLEVIEGTGSALFLDKPQAFNQILEAFLGEH